jgi:NAD(P)-dependent dehydrogenase (short-subunit alcohol dehydrogenase family)
MDLTDRVVVVTGGAHGIGAALGRRFLAAGAATVVLADIDADGARATAAGCGAAASYVDVADEASVGALVTDTLDRYGRIDVFCANAGITTGAGLDATTDDWQRSWSVNVLGHVYAARAVLPSMLERGFGYLLHTCSAAGLLTAIDDAPYAVTKHAAVAFAEWLAVTYGDRGIRVSALCPQGVDTAMLRDGLAAGHRGAVVTAAAGRVLRPDEVADAVVAGLAAERFLILPHPQVQEYEQRRVLDRDRWLSGMRRVAGKADA